MAKISDYLEGKQFQQAKEFASYANKNNFHISFTDQSKGHRPRIFITIHPEGRPKSVFERSDSASYYFYLNKEDKKDDFGSFTRPEKISGEGGKSYKNFKRFFDVIKERYERRYKNSFSKVIKKIAKEILIAVIDHTNQTFLEKGK